ncbi:nitric oxide synthase oxygenase [Paenibacillus spongiae]|uniref:Nitric oxide synthase oxygenase n=1 Tax=Paenibacillus spongiae TaxID=2909671 RepID=A0ABY5SJA1_9BACL|nr:nitric oxide synthase oxygenase [Paenibacillus spongiae]UVI33829.1 nitric oxide synthase oxygenase [Paenibacillus spongiae]
MEESEAFIRACYRELGRSRAETEERVREVRGSIEGSGTYTHTFEELEHGARMAWRNSNRCIGRLFWESMHVLDARGVQTEEEMAEALYRHIDYATNEGRIRPAITVFPQAADTESGKGPRIWNYQLIRYAGYETPDGVIGDPDSVKLTQLCQSMGWTGAGTAFDALPLIVQLEGRTPALFRIPERLILEVPLAHPEYERFSELALKWYAVPMVSSMRLEIGGISYTAAPFNGWYMGTEIGARNLADEFRYDMLPRVAEIMGLDTSRESSLWRDRALVEMNVAVLDSFKREGVTIVDHHTAAKQFARFTEKERQEERAVTGDWTWLIPPVSPATTHIFHTHYDNKSVSPNFYYQEDPYWSD